MKNLSTSKIAKLNSHGILSNWGIHENDWGKGMNSKESWYNSNLIVVRSNFNLPNSNSQTEKMSG